MKTSSGTIAALDLSQIDQRMVIKIIKLNLVHSNYFLEGQKAYLFENRSSEKLEEYVQSQNRQHFQ